jgi:DNA invertase Pin-like site-specific DNA recombinase
MYWPAKYYKGLTRRQNSQRKRSATRRTKMSWKNPKAYVPFKSDKGVKTRKSSYSSRFHKKYPDTKSLAEIATATGISKSTLQTVYDRGMAAWRTGHRPGASAQAWGMARVHSFVLHGKTWRTADADLARKTSQ